MTSSNRSQNEMLEYAPPSEQARTRRIVRRIAWSIFAVAVVSVALAGLRRFAIQFEYVRMQRSLATYVVTDGPVEVGPNGEVIRTTKWPSAAPIIPSHLPLITVPIFIHERRAADDSRQLVVVYEAALEAGWNRLMILVAKGYAPATMRLGSQLQEVSNTGLSHGPIRIHGGVADPNDESHFTIAYETAEGNGVIDGWLLSSGDLRLEPRDGPLKNR